MIFIHAATLEKHFVFQRKSLPVVHKHHERQSGGNTQMILIYPCENNMIFHYLRYLGVYLAQTNLL